ncbi:hypothetical protein Ae406Ps2_3338 [Pseudonocardia sp. Ae406_Ps2]|nr:hypothetical protein Ae331Ps2_2586c [Pseudonocardia sp. Ae331_Ps2]OLM03338.1 hypothetical protein Ae406Ps2_3338 [Pseudonocardia sp. Ae406_Ps2]OLM24903.1 hypothetical protein Ae706Ps2_3336 [Pseudonocardia sp. Ae706_Ps2]
MSWCPPRRGGSLRADVAASGALGVRARVRSDASEPSSPVHRLSGQVPAGHQRRT